MRWTKQQHIRARRRLTSYGKFLERAARTNKLTNRQQQTTSETFAIYGRTRGGTYGPLSWMFGRAWRTALDGEKQSLLVQEAIERQLGAG